MSRLCPILIVATLAMAGCLSPETRAEIDRLSSIVAALEVRSVAAPADEALRAELESARAALEAAKSNAIRERIGDAAGKVEQGAQVATPIAGYVFPPAIIILGIIAAVAGAIKGVGKPKPPLVTTLGESAPIVKVTVPKEVM